MTLLLAAHTLLGGAMVLAIFFVDRLGPAGWLMVLIGVGMIFTSMGCVTRDVPRFGLALGVTSVTLAGALVATAMNLMAAHELEAELLRRAKPGAIVYIYAESGKGGRLATLWLAWKVCLLAAVTNAALAAYLPARLFVRQRARRRSS